MTTRLSQAALLKPASFESAFQGLSLPHSHTSLSHQQLTTGTVQDTLSSLAFKQTAIRLLQWLTGQHVKKYALELSEAKLLRKGPRILCQLPQ